MECGSTEFLRIFARKRTLLPESNFLSKAMNINRSFPSSCSPLSINVNGTLMEFDVPRVMGILNVTPDSFYSGSRKQTETDIAARVRTIVDEGADMIDIGAYSSRSGADDVSVEEEMSRLRTGLEMIRREAPGAVVSVDTFRADVAAMCVEEYGVAVVNDISGGSLDPSMFRTVARLGVPYVLMHMQGEPRTMQQNPCYEDLMREVFLYFSEKVLRLRSLGVSDIILDPGFGFGKTLEHNYEMMDRLENFHEFGLPLLVGISRKSMIYRLLGGTPEDSLNGTTVLNTMALMKGAHILRVHDVKAAAEAVRIFTAMRDAGSGESRN